MITDQVSSTLDTEDEIGQQVGAVWRDVLRKDASSPELDFFEAGGNSMLLLAMLELLHKRVGVEIPLDDLSEGVTIARLTELVQRGAAQG